MDLLEYLIKLEDALKCRLCNLKCVDPVRIKTCGHYFCDKCLKASGNLHNCPKCNEFYEVKHLDYDNIAKQCDNELGELYLLLMPSENVTEQNTIWYEGNQYHVNFYNTHTKTNAKGETLLHLACKKGRLDQVRDLIASNVDINAKDFAGWAPLHEAIQSESLNVIEYLLKQNCLINIPGPDYVTPLHQAAGLNNASIVQLLINYGADKDLRDCTGLKPVDSSKTEAVKGIFKSHTLQHKAVKTFEVFLPNHIFVYCHSIDEEVKNKLMACKSIEVVKKADSKSKLTHFVIKKTHKLSFKIMQAMLDGLQFLTEDEVDLFIEGNYFIDIPNHIFLTGDQQLNKGIQRAMMSAILKLPKLFDGINFYIEDHNNFVDVYHLKVDKEYLTRLIKAGGGKVLHRPPATRVTSEPYHSFFASELSKTYHCCNFIIFNEKNPPELLYNMKELQHKSSKWLVDCIIKYEIVD